MQYNLQIYTAGKENLLLFMFRLSHEIIRMQFLSVAGLAQSVERLTAEREVAGSIPGAGPLLRVLKWLRNEGTSFALQAARPSRGSDDYVKMAVPSPLGDVKIVPQLARSC